ncbi:MAG TPA: hypothetical protein VFF52_07065 [Isosphaeraceae bacterium]|nr:hypothetical protein [Isosphaeraceae bacterium]
MSRSAALPLEILESRILLSNSSGPLLYPGIVTGFGLVSPTVVIPWAMLPASSSGTALKPATVLPAGNAGIVPEGMFSIAEGGSPAATLTVVHTREFAGTPLIGGGGLPLSSALALMTPVLSVTSYTRDTVGEDAIPPVVVHSTPSPAAPPATPAPIPTTPVPPSSPPTPTGVGVVAKPSPPPATSPPPASSTSTSTEPPSLPPAKHVQVDTDLDTNRSTMTIVIPVSPGTQAVGVSVHSATDSNEQPVLDRMELVDGNGSTIAQISSLEDPQAGAPSSAVTVALRHAPVGGDLLVEVSIPSESSTGSSPGTGSTPSNWELPIVVDVQRQDAAAAPVSVAWPSGGAAAIGSLPPGLTAVAAPGATPSAAASLLATQPAFEAPDVAVVNQSPGSMSWAESTGATVEPGEFWATPVATGPLAARSAAPLGPALATVLADTAPPVDRHERALSQAIDGLTSEDDGGEAAWRSELARIEESAPAPEAAAGDGSSSQSDEGTVELIIGLGALPILGTAVESQPERGELARLLESLPASVGSEDLPAIVVDADPGRAGLAVPWSLSRRGLAEEREFPDNLTLACGFVLVLGLSYGPLLPDLLAVVQARSSPWCRAIPAALRARRLAAAT